MKSNRINEINYELKLELNNKIDEMTKVFLTNVTPTFFEDILKSNLKLKCRCILQIM